MTRNGTATRRLQLRGQRRTLPLRAPPASRLSPAVTPEAGNLDRPLQHHLETAVNRHIKTSLYAVRSFRFLYYNSVGGGAGGAFSCFSSPQSCNFCRLLINRTIAHDDIHWLIGISADPR